MVKPWPMIENTTMQWVIAGTMLRSGPAGRDRAGATEMPPGSPFQVRRAGQCPHVPPVRPELAPIDMQRTCQQQRPESMPSASRPTTASDNSQRQQQRRHHHAHGDGQADEPVIQAGQQGVEDQAGLGP